MIQVDNDILKLHDTYRNQENLMRSYFNITIKTCYVIYSKSLRDNYRRNIVEYYDFNFPIKYWRMLRRMLQKALGQLEAIQQFSANLLVRSKICPGKSKLLNFTIFLR